MDNFATEFLENYKPTKEGYYEVLEGVFLSLHSPDNGGSGSFSKLKGLLMEGGFFYNCSSDKEGGSLFVLDSNVTMKCDFFYLCRAAKTGNEAGGNSFRLGNCELHSLDVVILKCWESPECGDGSILVYNGLSHFLRANLSFSFECGPGETLSFQQHSKSSWVTYMNLIENTPNSSVIGLILSSGSAYFDRTNIINNKGEYIITTHSPASCYLNHCCIYGNEKNSFFGVNPVFDECKLDFKDGIRSSIAFKIDDRCFNVRTNYFHHIHKDLLLMLELLIPQ